MANITEEVLPGRRVPPGWLITARSHFIDRYLADCERIFLPEREEPDGVLRWRSGHVRAEGPTTARRWPVRRKTVQMAPEGRWFIDLRPTNPDNWAHFLNNHLPRFFHVAQTAGRDPDRALLLLPKATPRHILAVVDLLGLTASCSDDDFEGDGIVFEGRPPVATRRMRVKWTREAGYLERVLEGVTADRTELPERVFLSRKDSRTLFNEVEIEAALQSRGFAKVYPETLSVPAQFRLFREAREMVAVHGAGLAPLMFCEAGQGPRRLVEILPVGHMTDVYREMAHAVGTDWIGVRGRIKPEYVAPAYDLDAAFTKYSLDAFEVDPVSLDLAFDMLEETK